MSIERDKIIVVDLEATCWKKGPPPGQQNEIIEIGVCLLDVESLEIEDKRGLIVKPTRSKVSAFCTRLTSLTQEMVDRGTTFEAACETLTQDYGAPGRLWSSWGGYDLRMFKSQCDSFAVPYPFSSHHVDLKGLYAAQRNNGKRVGLARAFKQQELTMAGRHHRGDDDAYNTARLLAKLLREDGREILEPYWHGE